MKTRCCTSCGAERPPEELDELRKSHTLSESCDAVISVKASVCFDRETCADRGRAFLDERMERVLHGEL